MKILLALVTLTLAFSAVAAEVKIMDVESNDDIVVRSEIVLNKELGRVWVEVDTAERYSSSEGGMADHYYRTKVEGLEFNASTGEAVFTHEGVATVCAKLKKGIFGSFLKPTKSCKFTSKRSTYQVDNGYEIEERELLSIFLVTK